MATNPEWTDLQQLYIDASLASIDAREAFINAGQSSVTAGATVRRMKRNAELGLEIQRLREERRERALTVSREEVIRQSRYLYETAIQNGDYKEARQVTHLQALIGRHIQSESNKNNDVKTLSQKDVLSLGAQLERARARILASRSEVIDIQGASDGREDNG